jgi:hypothetical protein
MFGCGDIFDPKNLIYFYYSHCKKYNIYIDYKKLILATKQEVKPDVRLIIAAANV